MADRHTVLTGTGLGDEPGLAHPLGEKRLTDDVVDLVRTGVVEILALQEQAQTEFLTEAVALGQARRTTGVVAEHRGEFLAPFRVVPRLVEGPLELLAGRHERLGDESPAELPKTTRIIGLAHQRSCVRGDRHSSSQS